MRLAVLFFLPCIAGAQLVAPTAVPVGSIPVVFLNGYQLGCIGDTGFKSNFDDADAVLKASGLVTVYFDNCSVPNSPSLETLGAAFGQFIASLKHTDGTAVPLVDVVAHSMGGLIVRAYLSGMHNAVAGMPATFTPPAVPGIRKVIFLATPHFGTYVANYLGDDTQTHEMSLGSQFLFDLNTWNQGTDDLSGVDALAIAGNGGTALESVLAGSFLKGFDDGIVELTSASIGFAIAGRTRVVPDCHTTDPLLVADGVCSSSTPALNAINDTSNVVGQIITSFLTGTSTWTTLGEAIEKDPNGSTIGGLLVEAEDLNGVDQKIANATANGDTLGVNAGAAAYKEALPASTSLPVEVNVSGAAALSTTVTLAAGTTTPLTAKPGPSISGVVPGGIAQYPRDVAPGAFVTAYGSNLTSAVLQSGQPYPTQLGDVQVLVNGIAVPVQYAGPTQINFIFAFSGVAGVQKLTVKNSTGQQTVNVVVVPAVPTIFTSNFAPNGPASAENAVTAVVINANTPLHAGDYVALYMTGIDETITSEFGLRSTVTVGGQSCAGQYFFAGAVPGYVGLDQVNCQIPSGVTGAAVPVVVTTNGRASNTATLNIQ